MRLIDADALLEKKQERDCCFTVTEWDILNAPTVVPVKHGKWVVTHLPDVFQCDYCKKATKMDELCDSEILRAYCPNCGARMDGE